MSVPNEQDVLDPMMDHTAADHLVLPDIAWTRDETRMIPAGSAARRACRFRTDEEAQRTLFPNHRN